MTILYSYTKSPCAVDQLTQEIQLSTIVTALDHIELSDSDLSIFFVSSLSGGDNTTLDTLVTNHTGTGLATDFIKATTTTTTSSSSNSYVVLNTMTTPHLIPGLYFVLFRGDFSTNVPLLTNPGIYMAVFNDGTAVADSEMLTVNNNSGAPFTMMTLAHIVVGLNKVVDVRWKTNGSGNTMTCTNRMLALIRQK